MKYRFTITGLDCPNCAAKLAGMMEKLDGVDAAKINFLSERLTVESALEEDALVKALQKTANAFESGIEISK